MMVATPVWGAKNKVVKIGERPESVTKGFGGKYYVTVMNSPDKEGDAVIKVLDGDMSKVFAKGLNEPKGIAFTGKFLVTADQTQVMKIDRKGNVSVLVDKMAFPREVSFLNDVEVKELKRTIRLVARNLGAHHITGPEEYFEKFHSDLGLPPSVLGETRELWSKIKDDLSWQGKKPSGIAGVVLYYASQNSTSPRTQSEVCSVSGISEVTLRGLLKILNQMIS